MMLWLRFKSRLRRIPILYRAYAWLNIAKKLLFDFVSLHTRDVLDREGLRTRYASATQYFDSSESANLANSHFELHASTDISFSWMLEKTFTFDVPSITHLEDAEVVGNSGVVLAAEGDIVLESTLFTVHYYRRSWDSGHVLFRRRLEAEDIDGPTLSLLSPLSTNYFHWTAECLPRLFALGALPGDLLRKMTFLINGDEFPFQRQSLTSLFGIEETRIRVRKTLRTRVKSLYVPTYRHQNNKATGFQDLHSLRVFRQMHELHRARFSTSPPFEHLLLLRSESTTRQIENAEEFLKRFPFFRPVRAEGLSVAEQMSLFASARAVASVHGAGLTNLIFCPPGCEVIEFYPAGWPWRNALCFLPISWANRLNHHIVEVDRIPTGPGPFTENVRFSERHFRIVEGILETSESNRGKHENDLRGLRGL